MPVKTTISETDFKEIISKYDLGDYVDFETFANGAGQTTVLISTTQGKYVLRYYENRPEQHTLFEVNLFNYLNEQNYPAPQVIKDKDNNQHGIYKEKPYILIEYIEGKHTTDPNKELNKLEAEKIIEVIAKLHSLTKD
jgi:homoserine kinase type II